MTKKAVDKGRILISSELRSPQEHAEVFSNSHQIQKSYFETLKKVVILKKKLFEGVLTFDYGGRPIKAIPADIVRVISQGSVSSSVEEIQKNIILNAILSLEKRSPFSGLIFLSLFEENNRNTKKYRLRTTEDDLFYLVRNVIGSGMCYEIFKGLYSNSGLFTEIEFVESQTKNCFDISTIGGKRIDGSVHMLFQGCPKNIQDASVICLDGIIEKVSELHKILEESSQENKKVVIFAHGFAPDVVHTLSENFKTGKLNVFPFVVKDRELTWKVFEDEGISTIRRENFREISTASLEDFSEIETLSFNDGYSIIYNRSLENLKTTIVIPKHFRNQSGLIEDRIRSAVEYAKDLSKYGVVLDSSNNPICGIAQRKEALKVYESFEKSSQNIGCIVVRSR